MGDQQNSSSSGQPLNQFQMPQQPPTHIYAGQSQHASSSSAQIPTQPIPYYNPGQQQFLQTMQGFYPQHPSYIAYPYILPSTFGSKSPLQRLFRRDCQLSRLWPALFSGYERSSAPL